MGSGDGQTHRAVQKVLRHADPHSEFHLESSGVSHRENRGFFRGVGGTAGGLHTLHVMLMLFHMLLRAPSVSVCNVTR